MKLTAQEEYGLRCTLQVARHAPPGLAPVSIREVAEAEGISVEYAAKLLRVLRQQGLVSATRGASGGFSLAREPGEIMVAEVLRALDGPMFDESFCSGHTGQLVSCVHSTGCAIRALWGHIDDALEQVLGRVSLADLLGPARERPAPWVAVAQEGRHGNSN